MKSLCVAKIGFLLLLLAACQTAPTAPARTATVLMIPEISETAKPSQTQPAAPTQTGTAVPPPICSPLEGFSHADLLARVSNPFDPPEPGSDNPHQGVDLGDFDPADASRVAVPGRTVQAALPGRVALIQTDRFPYGTAIIIETPLDALPATLHQQFATLPPWPPRPATDPLTCPTVDPTKTALSLPKPDQEGRSLYILYAHLGSMADIQVGDAVECGQALGTVGQSGNALAPHLHFEARVGPAGVQLGSLAHYDVSASVPEMAAYCLWRVSGSFVWVDPLLLLQDLP
ncbi:MAG TPA: M23 family metallopeptidase [Longilinea sp.]|nr:M23 family metallopeptidase [Longilinea sp.]